VRTDETGALLLLEAVALALDDEVWLWCSGRSRIAAAIMSSPKNLGRPSAG
jgi:hypothetical protein